MTLKLRKEDCELAVKNTINSKDFVLKELVVMPLYDKNVGFLGRHVRFTATIIHEENLKELKFFAKSVPITESHRQLVIEHDYFGKEINVYNTLIPKLSSSLPTSIKLPVPKCVFTRGTKTPEVPGSEDEEVIILEDVTRKGYRLLENCPPLDLMHCQVVLRALAKFHAASLLLENSAKSPEVFSCAKESFLINDSESFGYKWSKCSVQSLVTAGSQMWPHRFDGKRDKISAALLEGWKRTFEIVRQSKKYQNVLCHGDLWTNNALFSYESQCDGSEQPANAILVDLQFVRYAPPITDILLLLHVCTRKAFRDQYVDHLLRYYHSSLEEFTSPELLRKKLPLRSLLESYSELKLYGIMISTGYMPVILQEFDPLVKIECDVVQVKDLFFVNKGDKIVSNCEKSEYYKERIEENYDECLRELGF